MSLILEIKPLKPEKEGMARVFAVQVEGFVDDDSVALLWFLSIRNSPGAQSI